MKRMKTTGSSVREKRRMGQRMVSWILAFLCLGAAVLVLLHLRPDPSYEGYYLRRPRAATRSVEPVASHQPLMEAVRVNSATADELVTIPGVGPTLAEAILNERIQHGFFYYPEDLLCVKGIGEKTLQKLLPYVNLD